MKQQINIWLVLNQSIFDQYERNQYLIDFETNQYLINMKQINQVSGLSPLSTAAPNLAVTPGKAKPHHSFNCPTVLDTHKTERRGSDKCPNGKGLVRFWRRV